MAKAMIKDQLVSKNKIRSEFLAMLSRMYSEELPEYKQFVEIVNNSNQEFIKNNPNVKVDKLSRVIEERHGAIRVGKPEEMRIVARIFACLGMEPINFYDLTSVKKAMPIIATAFRPKTEEEINESAFRMFCSMLFLDDDRFFNDEQRQIAKTKLAKRKVFSDKLLEILDIAENQGGLTQTQSQAFLEEAVNSFRIDLNQVIDFKLYKDFIINGNDVAADIICFSTIHINHLTPRVYDIFDAHQQLKNNNIPTINEVQGPPKRRNEEALPLLNQTSRKAPGEFIYASTDKKLLNDIDYQYQVVKELEENNEIKHIEPKESEDIKDYLNRVEAALKISELKVVAMKHKARFGEIECRGVALTPEGRAAYDKAITDGTYVDYYPKTHLELAKKKYAYYKYSLANNKKLESKISKDNLLELAEKGYVILTPITYEDFLPKSAAGIFESNLSSDVKIREKLENSTEFKNQKILEEAIGKKIINSYELYEAIEQQSILKLMEF